MHPVLLRAVVLLLALSGFCPVPSVRASAEGDDLRAADAELNAAYQTTQLKALAEAVRDGNIE